MKLSFIFALVLVVMLHHASAQTFTNSTSIAVPAAGTLQGPASSYPSAIGVFGVGAQLTGISVTVSNFTHPYPADVDVLLVGPQGQDVMLMSDVGSFSQVAGLNFTFNHTSSTSMPSGSMLMSGTFAPTNFDPVGDVDGFPAPAPLVGPYGSSLTPFLNTDPNGQWKLYIVDDVAGNDGQFAGGWSITVTTSGPAVLQLMSAVSRKMHGTAGDFEVDLPLMGAPGVECRSSGGNHTLVFTFSTNVISGNASVTSGTATISGSPTFTGNTMTVNLTGVTDMQTVGVMLADVTGSAAQVLADTTVNANFLVGDASANNAVNGSDVSQVKLAVAATVSAANFRNDITPNGSINSSDVGQTKAASGNSISPSAPRAK